MNNFYPDLGKALLATASHFLTPPTFNDYRAVEPCASCEYGPNHGMACGGGMPCRKKGLPAGVEKLWDKGPDGYVIEVGWHVPAERADDFAKGLK